MQEIWKDIKGYENIYQISNKGNVKSLHYMHTGRGKILKPSVKKDGYLHVGLWKNGKQKFFKVHRLVAMAFLPNPNNLPQVNHKDENKENNVVKNLEYCDAKYNSNYGTRTKRIAEKMKGKHHSEETKQKMSEKHINGKNSKLVLQMDKTNKIIAEFPSVSEVQRQLGISITHISECCNGNRKTCGGYKWQYK